MVKICNASTGSEKGEEMSSFTGTTISTIYQYTILRGQQAHFLAWPRQYFDYHIIINPIMYTTHATLIICVFCNHSIVFLLYVEPWTVTTDQLMVNPLCVQLIRFCHYLSDMSVLYHMLYVCYMSPIIIMGHVCKYRHSIIVYLHNTSLGNFLTSYHHV